MDKPLFAVSAVLLGMLLAASAAGEPVDGPGAFLHDPLLDKIVGHWTATGTIAGEPQRHQIEAKWILNHQFLQIDETAIADPKSGQASYEALPMIGYDNRSERYVMHWFDYYGGRFSETLGYGTRHGDEIDFVFEYPDGPFHTNFIWDGVHERWHWLMSQKDENGKWTSFADLILTKR